MYHSVINNLRRSAIGVSKLNQCGSVKFIPSRNLSSAFTNNRHRKCFVQQSQDDAILSVTLNNIQNSRNFSISIRKFQSADPAPATVTTEIPSVPTETSSKEIVLDFLPEKPTPIQIPDDAVSSAIQFVGDPPLDALGLASWWPAGRIQYLLEQLHVSLDLPWWACIMIVTLCIRLITINFVIQSQRNTANMANHMPKVKELQGRISSARARGDMYDASKYGLELQEHMTEKGINPLKSLVPMLVQFPFFASMFVGLRGMANLPVESLTTGGLFWFTDLTEVDPYYILPLLTSSTLFLQLKLGADGLSSDAMGKYGKIFMTAMPGILFLFTMNFPAALTMYWFTTNVISVGQAKLLRTPKFRKMLNIQEVKPPTKDLLPDEKKGFAGFIDGIKDSVNNARFQAKVIDLRKADEDRFREAGSGSVRRTFTFDPTKSPPKKPKRK